MAVSWHAFNISRGRGPWKKSDVCCWPGLNGLNVLGFRDMIHKEKIKSCTSVRHEHSEIYTQTGRSEATREQTWTSGYKRLGRHTETVPHLSIHQVSSQVVTLMTSSCSAHTHSLSPTPVVSWLGVLEERRGRWRALTRGTQTLEAIDFVHTLPIVYTRVALAFIHLQLTMHTFETCTNGPHMQFRQNKGAFPPRKHTCAEIAKAPVSMSSSPKSS